MPHNNERPIRKAIGVVRRSDVKQKENASLLTQKEEILAKAKLEGYTIVDIFEDDGLSAYHLSVSERPAMIKALKLALSQTEEIEALFFYEESRLSRQFSDFVISFYNPVKKEKPHFAFFSTKKVAEWNPNDITSVFEFATAAKDSSIKSARIIDAQGESLKVSIKSSRLLK
ncbi:recombinase family protein [Bacillus sp. 1P06AnD]|uniref:recombinase family protein n=1 Tax=Bacillus sp. 1P06AnD TaxID=3132208 RepID=UPI0039A1C5B5